MKKVNFVEHLIKFCEFKDQEISMDTPFKSIEGYDSIGIMSMIAFLDKNFKIKITSKQIHELKDLNSLINLIGEEKFD